MRISAKIDYACRALLELSLHWPSQEPLQISIIAERQKMPLKFLTHILINLKQLGYVDSLRGKKGGYLLAMSPRDINLALLIHNLGQIGYSATDNKDIKKNSHVMGEIWQEIDESMLKLIEVYDFESIANKQKSKDEVVMFHI